MGFTIDTSPEIGVLPVMVTGVLEVVLAESTLPLVGSVAPVIDVLPVIEIVPLFATPKLKMLLAFCAIA